MKMKKFILKEKLSKKARKALNAQKRVLWETTPISKVIPNKKKDHLQSIHLKREEMDN